MGGNKSIGSVNGSQRASRRCDIIIAVVIRVAAGAAHHWLQLASHALYLSLSLSLSLYLSLALCLQLIVSAAAAAAAAAATAVVVVAVVVVVVVEVAIVEGRVPFYEARVLISLGPSAFVALKLVPIPRIGAKEKWIETEREKIGIFKRPRFTFLLVIQYLPYRLIAFFSPFFSKSQSEIVSNFDNA